MRLRFLNWQISVERIFASEEHLAHLYTRVANRWEEAIARMGYPYAYQRLFQELHERGELAGIPTDGLILDAGIGTGALSAALTNRLPASRIVGVDVSPAMLSQAQKHIPQLIDARQASITDLPFPDAHFDYVITAHVLEHLPDATAGLNEMMRVLKPGRPFLVLATRPCPITRLLSLRWNFAALPEHTMRKQLAHANATLTDDFFLAQPLQFAYMTRVYLGHRPAILH
jgi:ubiquinone/menaquinone biosynthesis C-methylase UbiE